MDEMNPRVQDMKAIPKVVKDYSAIEVVLPTKLWGDDKKPIRKLVSKHDFESHLKQMGFVTSKEFDEEALKQRIVEMWSPDGKAAEFTGAQVDQMKDLGFTLEPPKKKTETAAQKKKRLAAEAEAKEKGEAVTT